MLGRGSGTAQWEKSGMLRLTSCCRDLGRLATGGSRSSRKGHSCTGHGRCCWFHVGRTDLGLEQGSLVGRGKGLPGARQGNSEGLGCTRTQAGT